MLTNFQVQNFKAFEDTGILNLKLLTLLSGINSAGKSSIIQALLLLKQTLESAPSLALAPGKGVWLGQSLGDNFSDFIFGRPDLENATLTYNLGFTYNLEDDVDLYVDCKQLYDDLQQSLPQNTSISADLHVAFQGGRSGYHGRPTVFVSELDIALSIAETPLVALIIRPYYDVSHNADKTASFLQGFAFNTLKPTRFSNFLPGSLIPNMRRPSSDKPVPLSVINLFSDCFAAIYHDLSEQICYLNSFREPPARIYAIGQTSGGPLVPNGKNFAEILWHYRNEWIYFAHPDLPYPDQQRPYEMPLDDLVAWVLRQLLGLEQSVIVQPVSEGRADILEVKVATLGKNKRQVTLADVGLGYNQILPVVLQGLLTPPGGLVIFEQPEIHLHPDVQAKLISFFIGLARTGRRVLVETHSSYMIEYLCLEIAQDRSNWLAENAQTLFVHAPDADHAGAWIAPVTITP